MTANKLPELLPCPFCGCDCILRAEDTPFDFEEGTVVCDGCGATAQADTWNRRSAAGGCDWTLDADEYMTKWDSACGESWSFTEGGPEDNNVRFCQGCGKPVRIAPTISPDEREGDK